MKIVDNSGRIFTIESYNQYPIGYEYEETDYIFWINKDYQNYLSINNYYSKVINLLIPVDTGDTGIHFNGVFDNLYDIKINVDSKVFSLISSNDIRMQYEKLNHINDYLELNDVNKKELNSDDLFCIKVRENNADYFLVPLYVVSTSREEGSWYTNILVTLYNKITELTEYTYFTVGGEFIDEYEELIINGKNMGISLPKDIIKAVYQGSYYNSEFNTDLYNQKLKEYLLNYMGIRGELGNFKSVENSVKWFGWGEHVSISKLLQTDNQFKNQFIRDYFNIEEPILDSYYLFRNSTYISIVLELYKENGELNDYITNYYNDELICWDYGTPKQESLLNKIIESDDNDCIKYLKPYFDYNFTELGLKLACFKHYLKNYFLPIHLSILSMSLNERVYMNDLKTDCYDKSTNIVYPITESYDKNNLDVYFSEDNNVYLQKLKTIVDNNFNDFNKKTDELDLYKIDNEICLQLPIYFNDLGNTKLYNCTLLLSREGDKHEYGYYIDINYLININDNVEIYDYNLNKLNNDDLYFCYSTDSKKYSTFVKGLDNLYTNIIKSNSYKCSLEFKYKKINGFTTTPDPNNNLTTTEEPKSAYEILNIRFVEENGDNKIKDLYIPINDILDENKTYFYYTNEDVKNYVLYIDSNNRNKIKEILNKNFIYKDNKYYYIISEREDTGSVFIKKFINIPIINDFYIRVNHNTDKIGIIKINSLELNRYLPFYKNVYILSEQGVNININNKFYWLNKGGFFLTETSKSVFVLEESKHYKTFNEDLVNIKFLPTNTLLYESSFIFHESELYLDSEINKKYFNFIICPKYIVKSNNQSMWVNNKFRIDLLVNGVWYNYVFNTKIAQPNIVMSKLQYMYENENNNYIKSSYFSQLSDITDDRILFNTYSNINNLSLIEHNNFYEDYIKYYSNSNLKYLDSYKFINDNFYYSICYNNTYIYFDEFTKEQNSFKYSEDKRLESDKYDYCYLTAISDNKTIQFKNVENDIYSIEKNSNDNYNNYLTFYINKDKNNCALLNDDNTYTYYNITSNINYNLSNTFLNKYNEEYNIINNKKYYNNILLFDIYKDDYVYEDKYILTNNTSNIYYDNDKNEIGELSFSYYSFNLNDKEIISYIEYYLNGSTYNLNTYSHDISYIKETNLYTKNSISGLYSYNNEYTRNFYKIIETKEKDSYFNMSYISYNISDIFNTTGDDVNSYICGNSYYKILECNYSYNKYSYNTYNLLNLLQYVSYKKNNKLKLNENNHYILMTSYNNVDENIKDKMYICYINPLGVNYIINNIDNIKNNSSLNDNKILNTFMSYNYLDIHNLYFTPEFYIKDKYNVSSKINNPKYDQILSIYNEYYNKESNSKYFIKYNFTKNKYIKYTTNFEEIDENIDNKLYNDTVLHKSLTNSYYIDNNVINNSYTNNFNIQNINLLDYVDKEDLDNNEFTIRFKFELTENKEKNDANNITVLKPFFKMFTDYSKMNISIEESDNTYDYKITYNDIEEFNNSYNLYANKEIEFNIKRTKHTTEEPTIIKKRSTSTTTELSTTTTELYTTTEKPKDKLNMNISFNLYSKYKMTGYFNIKPIIQVKKKITDKLKYSSDNKANNNYNFYLNGNNYIFDDNTSEYNISLYKQFFEKQTKIDPFNNSKVIKIVENNDIKINDYDFYLMHDFNYWYGIYISKKTIDKLKYNDLNKKYEDKVLENNSSKFILKYYGASQQILPNRMKLIPTNGNNVFNEDDIIVMQNKNINLPINIFNKAKWSAEPISLGVENYTNESNSDLFILRSNKNLSNYYKGYYNVTFKYNIENFSQQQFKKQIKLLIK